MEKLTIPAKCVIIETIQKYKLLWNTETPSTKKGNKKIQKATWKGCAQELQLDVTLLKREWRSLVRQYRKHCYEDSKMHPDLLGSMSFMRNHLPEQRKRMKLNPEHKHPGSSRHDNAPPQSRTSKNTSSKSSIEVNSSDNNMTNNIDNNICKMNINRPDLSISHTIDINTLSASNSSRPNTENNSITSSSVFQNTIPECTNSENMFAISINKPNHAIVKRFYENFISIYTQIYGSRTDPSSISDTAQENDNPTNIKRPYYQKTGANFSNSADKKINEPSSTKKKKLTDDNIIPGNSKNNVEINHAGSSHTTSITSNNPQKLTHNKNYVDKCTKVTDKSKVVACNSSSVNDITALRKASSSKSSYVKANTSGERAVKDKSNKLMTNYGSPNSQYSNKNGRTITHKRNPDDATNSPYNAFNKNVPKPTKKISDTKVMDSKKNFDNTEKILCGIPTVTSNWTTPSSEFSTNIDKGATYPTQSANKSSKMNTRNIDSLTNNKALTIPKIKDQKPAYENEKQSILLLSGENLNVPPTKIKRETKDKYAEKNYYKYAGGSKSSKNTLNESSITHSSGAITNDATPLKKPASSYSKNASLKGNTSNTIITEHKSNKPMANYTSPNSHSSVNNENKSSVNKYAKVPDKIKVVPSISVSSGGNVNIPPTHVADNKPDVKFFSLILYHHLCTQNEQVNKNPIREIIKSELYEFCSINQSLVATIANEIEQMNPNYVNEIADGRITFRDLKLPHVVNDTCDKFLNHSLKVHKKLKYARKINVKQERDWNAE